MLVTGQNRQRKMEYVLIDDLMPQDHLLRKIDKYIDFSFMTLSTILCKRIMKHNHISQPRPHRISSFPRIRLQFG